jgi:hypothetical protein
MAMPTPERIKAASLEKRRRICVICGTVFLVKKTSDVGKTCSKPCHSTHNAKVRTGRKQSAETIARRSQSLRAARADPERNAAWNAAVAKGIAAWHDNPANAAEFAKRASDRMKLRHQEPDFQKRRDERSSRTMKATWKKNRDKFIAQAVSRYLRHRENGQGLWDSETIARKNEAAQWIMKRAQEAMHAETEYNAVFAEVQEQLRRETPYDGPQGAGDYLEYCQKIGTATVNDPRCRAIADAFMSEAIPRFSAEWRKR